MISKISFGSTYKFLCGKNDKKLSKVKDYCKPLEEQEVGKLEKLYKKPTKTKNQKDCVLRVYDFLDNEVEDFCNTNGIKYNKKSNVECVKDRIKKPDGDMKLAWVDYNKLLEIAKNHQSDIETVRDGYTGFFQNVVKRNFICETKIIPTYLNIKSAYLPDKDVFEQIKNQGVNSLEKDILLVDFVQKTFNLDHCTAFLLNEMGMKDIPFYMDDTTLKYADAMGIIKE